MKKTALFDCQCPVRCIKQHKVIPHLANEQDSVVYGTPTLIFVTRCTLKRKKDTFLGQNHPEKESGRTAFRQRFPSHSRPFVSNFITMVG